MAPVTRSQTKHLRLPEKQFRKQQEIAGHITVGMNNFERVIGTEYKLAVALVLFKYIESEKRNLHLLGKYFCKVVSLKMDEFINDTNTTNEFIDEMKMYKEKIKDYLIMN